MKKDLKDKEKKKLKDIRDKLFKRRQSTTTNTIEPLMAIRMIITRMRHTPTTAKVTGEKTDISIKEDLKDLSTTCNLNIPNI